MLNSYKSWKKLNENVGGGAYALGVSQPSKIADLHSRWDEMGLSMPPMKMKSKKMFGDDDMGSLPVKKGKKPPFPTPEGDEATDGPSDDLDADLEDDAPIGDEEPEDAPEDEAPDSPEDDLGAVDDEATDDEAPDDEAPDDKEAPEDDLEDDMGDEEVPGVGGPDDEAPMPAKKKGSFIDKTKAVADGAKLMHKGAKKMIKGMKENTDCGKCKMSKKKMSACTHNLTKEEAEFLRSLQAQTGGIRFEKNDMGGWCAVKEDAIIPPTDPNANLQEEEPGPGEVGYAPQGRVGGSFSEWATKYQRKTPKINESTKSKKSSSWFGQ